MRKQKASDKRTRRRQKGNLSEEEEYFSRPTLTQSPMQQRGRWNDKKSDSAAYERSSSPTSSASSSVTVSGGGRGRSRKRSAFYHSLSFYHDKFLSLLTDEYKAEEQEVIRRIEGSTENPVALEQAGFALYDMYPTRRGNLFLDEVYRLTKASDATTIYPPSNVGKAFRSAVVGAFCLPSNHKFSTNDVVMITRQPRGSGDLFDLNALPIRETAQKMEARVLGVGPTYVDIAVGPGRFESTFGRPAANDASGTGDKSLRVRVDLFFSPVPYQRMVTALAQISSSTPSTATAAEVNREGAKTKDPICTDQVIRDLILTSHALADAPSPFNENSSTCNLDELSRRIAKPPMELSAKLAQETIRFVQSNPQRFRPLNEPQLAAVQAALTRRCTLIQGPPGTGKTITASAIAFGFVHQCRSVSPHAKVMACAFSNVGADNLAEALLRIGFNVVRIGKPSAVAESLWNHTVEAAIARDPNAQKALQDAAEATANLAKVQRIKSPERGLERSTRQAATTAVQASIRQCNLAAVKAFREADVIVSTLTGAADPRLMAACGMGTIESNSDGGATALPSPNRELAPDGMLPLSLPFIIVDEACQSLEPATLIPIVSSNSCRSLVLLGDPCQLPPTVIHSAIDQSPLRVSLMERLASVLPHPNINYKDAVLEHETSFLDALPIRDARTLMAARDRNKLQRSYRKRFAGSFMLSIQYRMHPSIAAFPSAIFYDGLLSTPKDLSLSRPFPQVLKSLLPCQCDGISVRLVNIGGFCNERHKKSSGMTPAGEQETSYSNTKEANFVAHLANSVRADDEGKSLSIAIVSPYNGQVQLIQSILQASLVGNRNNTAAVEVKTVDSFQGRERDIVIFSAVRSNREGRIGFLHDWRRVNVALTRSKSALIIVGDFDTLAPADAHWAALEKWASGTRCRVDASNVSNDDTSLVP
ncbi:hypothetical protein ACA910_004847 [Epithemia clementina (nom. ined.)]